MKISNLIYSMVILNFCYIMDRLIISLFSFSKVKEKIRTLLSMEFWSNTKYVLLYLFLLAVLMRVIVYFLIPSLYGLTSDSIGYYLSAVNGVEYGAFSTYWPPGFPLLISLFINNIQIIYSTHFNPISNNYRFIMWSNSILYFIKVI